jgi:signal transduction histidine kinase
VQRSIPLKGQTHLADLHGRTVLNVPLTDRLLTAAARRHVARMVRAIAPTADRLDRRFAALLRQRRYNAEQIRAFLAITPAAASRLRTLPQFLEQVEYNGRRLAKLNVPPAAVAEVLREFGGLLDPVLAGNFEPAREQLQLATVLILNDAFYRVREAESQAFFGLYHAETEAAGLEDLLRRIVRILTPAFQASAGRLFLLDRPATGKLARPLYIERGQPDERLIADPEMRGRYTSYWSYPIGPSRAAAPGAQCRPAKAPAALVQFGFRVRYPWLPRELALLVAAGERCHEALERARMEREIRRLEAETRYAEEEERRRIGRELHDEAGQSMLLLRLQLEMIERDAPKLLRPRLAETRAIVERTVDELRRLIAALSPAGLDRLGLESVLRQLAARFRKVHPAGLRLRIPVLSESLPTRTQEVIYRVAQECLQNIAKHSGATRVNLSLSTADKSIRLSVADNGAGFCAETARNQPMSFGLAGMRERVALLGGTLAVRSAPGEGAKVTLQLPRSSAPVTRNGKNSRTLD